MTPSHAIRVALGGTLEARAIGEAEARRLFNPDREVNSLAERLIALRDHGVPRDDLRAIFTDLKAIIALNAKQCGHEADVAGQLDELAAALHHAETEAHVDRALGIKAIANTLRPALDVIANPAAHPAAAYVRSVRDVDRIIASTTRTRLLSASVRHELGAGKHDLLAELIGASA